MSKTSKIVTILGIALGILASLVTIAGAFPPPPPASLTLPLIVLQCYR
ncbi:hypothetical protein ACTXNP_22160 [Pseudomonas helleri]